jgi:LytTr DNA-binding domain
MREGLKNGVGGTALHLALREVQQELRLPLTWAILGAIIIVVSLSGPFQTLTLLSPLPRFAYWAFVVAACFVAANFFGTWTRIACKRNNWREPWLFLATGLACGLSAACVVLLANTLAFSGSQPSLRTVLLLVFNTTLIGMVITAVYTIVGRTRVKQKAENFSADEKPQPPRLMQRLPLAKRGTLISISATDHYVHVTTSRGKEMILMRLKDAMEEAAPIDGLQIHRSHWIAREAVRAVHRRSGRIIVEMEEGEELPASRSFIGDLRKAGLLR